MPWQETVSTLKNSAWAHNIAWLLVLAVIVFGIRAWQQHTLVEGPAPALQAPLVQGGVFDLAAPRERPVLVYFWATWCSVCRLEQGTIEALARDHEVVGIAMHSGTEAEVLKYLRDNNLAVRTINDPDGVMARAWGVRATPSSFIVGNNGNIRFREVGYTTEPGMRFRLWLAAQ